MSSSQLPVLLATKPNVRFLSPEVLFVFQLNVIPTLGRANRVMLLFIALSKYGSEPSLNGDTPCAVAAENVSAGVKDI